MRAFFSSARSSFKSATSSPIFPLIVLGICLRLALAPFLTWTIDASFWYRSAMDFMSGIGIYGSDTFSYPPLWAYTFLPFVWVLSLIIPPQYLGTYSEAFASAAPEMYMMVPTITSPLFNMAFKLPLILAETLVGILIYKIALEFTTQDQAKKAFSLWYLNPLVILCSTVFGQFDVFPAMMALLGIMLLYKKKYIFCGLAIGMGFLYKISPVFLLPLCFAFCAASVLRGTRVEGQAARKLGGVAAGCIKIVAGFSIPVCLFILPLLGTGIYTEVVSVRMKYETVNGMNMWFWGMHPELSAAAASFWSEWHGAILVLEAFLVAAISFAAFWTLLRGKLRGGGSFFTLIISSAIILLFAVLFPQKTNPNYIIWVLPFMVLACSIFNKWKILVPFVVSMGCIYYLSVPLPELLNTLSVYSRLLSPEQLASVAARYISYPGPITGFLAKDVQFISAGLGAIAFLWAAASGAYGIISPKAAQPEEKPGTKFGGGELK